MLVFILKSAITLALLYSCFFILLSKETFHRFNRVMLLGIMVAAFVVPMLHITTEHPTIINEEVQLIENMTDSGIVFIYEDEATEPQPQINWVQVMMWVYLTGVAVMLIITLIQVINLVRLMRGGIQQKDEQGNTIILINGEIPPFSIFHFIVMSVKDYESGRQYILTHEQEHIRLGHSYDLLLMQVLKTIQWFNPFVWFISRDLKTIHEYEADQAVINQGIDAKQYQLFLVKKVVGNRLQPFTNNLNHGSLKKRIAMMYQKKSNRWLMLKALFAIPVIALTISAFATPAAMKPVEELVKTIEEQTSPSFVLQDEQTTQNKLTLTLSQEEGTESSPLGGDKSGVPDIKPGQVLTGQVTDEKGEPLQTATVFEQDEQFRIYAKAVTDVNGNFAIKIVNPEHNIRVSYVSCKEFLTKISNMPKKVKLQPTDLIQIVDVNARKRDVAGGEPLLVVDGVIMQGVEHLDVNEPTSIDVLMLKEFGIKQSDIESVTVLKDGAATAIYGEKGKNGVIEIKTRVKQDTIVARVMNNENGLAIKSNNGDLPLDSMLNRLPGLEKQPDGSFTVNGKKVKRVLVDGEEMNLEDLVK